MFENYFSSCTQKFITINYRFVIYILSALDSSKSIFDYYTCITISFYTHWLLCCTQYFNVFSKQFCAFHVVLTWNGRAFFVFLRTISMYTLVYDFGRRRVV